MISIDSSNIRIVLDVEILSKSIKATFSEKLFMTQKKGSK